MQANGNGNSSAASDGQPSSGGHDDFFDQMLSSLPSSAWAELGAPKAPWELGGAHPNDSAAVAPYDESALLASRLRQHQIGGGGPEGAKPMMLQLNELHRGHHTMLVSPTGRSPPGGGELGIFPLPLSLGSGGSVDSGLFVDGSRDDVDGPFKSHNAAGGEGLYNGFGGSLAGAAEAAAQQPFHHPQGGAMAAQGYGGAPANGVASGGAAPPKQRVRARRGQATDPHSIAERLRRERIAERMKALQELVPNANKTDKASMLDEIIDYVKFLQLQVKVLSMSRLGGAAAVAPLVASMSTEGQGGASSNGGAAGVGSGSMKVTEQQVAKLMEEDMGSAMQYLQGKGLCLMPISLASAISTATTCLPPRASHSPSGAAPPLAAGPSSPSVSVLTAQSAMTNGGSDV